MRDFKFLTLANTHVEYYDTEDLLFFSLTPALYSPETFNPVKYMLYKHRVTGEIIKGDMIQEQHPMFNFMGRRI